MKNGILIIVADGQPGGGKDEFLRRLAADPWFMRYALFMEEAAARITLTYGITRKEKAIWTPAMWVAFQKIIVEFYRFSMAIALQRAAEQGRRVIFFNRYIPSGAAYLPSGLDELAAVTGVMRDEMWEGIDHVICPGPPPEKYYVRHEVGDPQGFRFETYEDACVLGAKARQAYIDLGFKPGITLHDIPGTEDFDEKCADFMHVARVLASHE
jgi:hypothetical protein